MANGATAAEATAAGGVVTVTGELNDTISVTFTNGVHTVTKTVTGTGSAQAVTLTATDLTTLTDGTISVTATQTDAAGNAQTAAAATTSFVLDTTAPSVTAVTDDVAATVTNTSITFTATFSEGVTGVSASSFTATNGTVASVTAVDSSHYTVVVNPTAGVAAGNVALSLVAGGATDTAGNAAAAADLSSLDSQGINTAPNHAPVFDTTSTITLLSVAGENSFGPAMSFGGRYTVFQASDGLPGQGDSNSHGQMFLYDRTNGTYINISDAVHIPDAPAGETYHDLPSIGGNFVVFKGEYPVTFNDGNGGTFQGTQSDIYIYNISANTTTRLLDPTSITHQPINGGSVSISRDGTLIAFEHGVNNGKLDIVVTDHSGNTLTDISSNDPSFNPTNSSNNFGNVGSLYSPSLSGDGRYVSFWSTSSDIAVGGTDFQTGNSNGTAQVYVYDRYLNHLTKVSVANDGITQGNANSAVLNIGDNNNSDDWAPALSPDGRFVVFQSSATNLVNGVTASGINIFLYDLQTHTIQLVSAAANGSGDSIRPAISPDGHTITFVSDAGNLPGATGGEQAYAVVLDPVTLIAGAPQLLSTGFAGFDNGFNALGDAVSSGGVRATFGGAALGFSPDQGGAVHNLDGTITFAGGPVADYHASATVTVTVHVGNGTLTPVGTPAIGLTITGDGSNGTLQFSGSLDAINHAMQSGVIYTPNAGIVSDTLTRTLVDTVNGTATQSMQFTPQAPQILNDFTNANGVAIDNSLAQAQFLSQGAVKFSVESISDFNPSFNAATGVLTVTLIAGDGTLAPVTATGLTIVGTNDGSHGTLEFTGSIIAVNAALHDGVIYTPNPGHAGSDTINQTIDDGHGGTATRTTQFNPQAPQVTLNSETGQQFDVFLVDRSATSGALIENQNVDGAGNLTAAGTLKFTDADLTDTHSVTGWVVKSAIDQSGNAITGASTLQLLHDAFGASVTAGHDSTNTGTGQVDWNIAIANNSLEGLPVAEGATVVYTLTLDDGHGGTVSQDVTITISDAPDVTVIGNANGNSLVGTAEDDILSGLGGNDRLQGLAGNDLLDGGLGYDRAIYTDATGPRDGEPRSRHGERGGCRHRHARQHRSRGRQQFCRYVRRYRFHGSERQPRRICGPEWLRGHGRQRCDHRVHQCTGPEADAGRLPQCVRRSHGGYCGRHGAWHKCQ